MSGGRSSDPPTVASRLLAVLGSFSASDAELKLVDISRRAGLAPSTIHRLVRELHTWGALEGDDERGVYRIGPRLRELARPTTR